MLSNKAINTIRKMRLENSRWRVFRDFIKASPEIIIDDLLTVKDSGSLKNCGVKTINEIMKYQKQERKLWKK